MSTSDPLLAPERIAVISDVHGNLTALDAVLADIDARGITTILNLGDVAGKGPRGSACVRRVRERCAVTVRGNWDDFLPKDTHADSPEAEAALRWWRDELTAGDHSWLGGLPLVHDLVLGGRRVRLLHASATSVYTRVFRTHTPEQAVGMFAATPLTGPGPAPDVVCYGDIHAAYLEPVGAGTLVNVGSVGNSLDQPGASWVILEGGGGSDPFGIQFVRTPYDVAAEIAVGEALGMPTREVWAVELRTAVYRERQVVTRTVSAEEVTAE